MAHQGTLAFVTFFLHMFWSMEKMLEMDPKWSREVLFPTNQDLASILGTMDLDFVKLYFSVFKIPRFTDVQIPRIPYSHAPPAPDEFSDPNLTPLPTHPGIKYAAKGPCCDDTTNHTYGISTQEHDILCCTFKVLGLYRPT